MIGSVIGRSVVRAYREAYSGLPRDVWLISLAAMVNRAGTMVLPFLSLYLTSRLGFTTAMAGQLLALYGLGSMAGSLLGGFIADRLGGVRVQQLSLLLTGAAFLVTVHVESFWGLALALPLLSAAADSYRPAVMESIARRATPEIQARAFALLRLAINLGMSIGPALGGFLAFHSYAWLFVADALTCWVAAVVLALTLGVAADRRAEPPGATAEPGRSAWRDGPFLALLVLVVLLGVVFFQLFSTMPLYLRDFYRLGERAVGGLISLNTVLIVLLEMVLIHRLQRRDPMKVLGWGCLLVGVGLALFPLGPAPLVAVVAMVVVTFGEMLSLPMSNAVVGRRAGRRTAGGYMGAYTLAFSVALVLGPALGTAVYDNLGGRVLWLGAGGLGALLWLGCHALAPLFERSAVSLQISVPTPARVGDQ